MQRAQAWICFIYSNAVVDRQALVLDIPVAYKPLLSRRGVPAKKAGAETLCVDVCVRTHLHPLLRVCMCVSWLVMEKQPGVCVARTHVCGLTRDKSGC